MGDGGEEQVKKRMKVQIFGDGINRQNVGCFLMLMNSVIFSFLFEKIELSTKNLTFKIIDVFSSQFFNGFTWKLR